jgi:RimK family alpha-L-glutamate ligase
MTMARFAVLTARGDLPAHRELAAAARRLGHRIEVLAVAELAVAARPPQLWRRGRLLDAGRFAAVLPRVSDWRPDSALAVLGVLLAAGVPSVNRPAAIRRGRDHWRTAAALAAAGLPHPETAAGSEPVEVAAAAAALCGFPCVVKLRRSRQGLGVVRCDGRAELEAVLDALWRLGEEVIVQRFCPPGGCSRRVLVLDGEVLGAAEHRAPAGEFRANAARGARVAAIAPDAETGALAVAAAQAIGLDFAGVDLLPDGGRWVVGEVNPTPGWRHFRRATGTPVAERLVAALERRSTTA